MKERVKISTMISKEAKENLDEVKNEGFKLGHFIDKAIKNEYKRLTKNKEK